MESNALVTSASACNEEVGGEEEEEEEEGYECLLGGASSNDAYRASQKAPQSTGESDNKSQGGSKMASSGVGIEPKRTLSTWDRAALALETNPRDRIWVEYTSADGSHYYYNVATQATSWSRPAGNQLIRPETEEAWIDCLDDKGRRYFHDVVHNVTSWKPPKVVQNKSGPQTKRTLRAGLASAKDAQKEVYRQASSTQVLSPGRSARGQLTGRSIPVGGATGSFHDSLKGSVREGFGRQGQGTVYQLSAAMKTGGNDWRNQNKAAMQAPSVDAALDSQAAASAAAYHRWGGVQLDIRSPVAGATATSATANGVQGASVQGGGSSTRVINFAGGGVGTPGSVPFEAHGSMARSNRIEHIKRDTRNGIRRTRSNDSLDVMGDDAIALKQRLQETLNDQRKDIESISAYSWGRQRSGRSESPAAMLSNGSQHYDSYEQSSIRSLSL